ncbi:MAG: DUF2911 domain-containing protein [Bacteroidia bacterium]|nr:DUF2911 domain-containing protein [Bacteroidia bacterium]
MKKLTLLKFGFVITALILFNQEGLAQSFDGLDNSPHDITYYRESRVTPPIVKVIYGRPQKKGEEVFGNKVAYGQLWRTGANEATEVKFYQDIMFGEVQVPAGTYVLYTIPGEKEWEIILSANLDVLGAFQYDPVFDVARITVPSNKAEELESFSIAFKEKKENIQMVLGWDTTRVKIPITINQKEEYALKF